MSLVPAVAARVGAAPHTGVSVAEPQQHQLGLNDRPRQRVLQLAASVVVAIDVAADAGAAKQLDIVAAGQQADIVDLRDPRHETLDGASDEVFRVTAAECVVERTVDLRRVHVARRTAAGVTTLAAAALVNGLDQ